MADRQKIIFHLQKDEDGYPPFSSEGVWATPLGNEEYRVDNIPFFIMEISSQDVVFARVDDNGDVVFRGVKESFGHSTIRIYFEDVAYDIKGVRAELESMGCSTEGADTERFVSIDVPPAVEISRIRKYLDKLQKREIIGIDDGCIQHAR